MIRLYSLLLFRFYIRLQKRESEENHSDSLTLFRSAFTLHICLWTDIAILLGIIRFFSQAQFDPTAIMAVTFFLVPIAAYLIDMGGVGVKIIRKTRRSLAESPEEEARNAKRVYKFVVIGSLVLFSIVGFMNTMLNKEQHLEQIQSTPEYQRMQERSREYQREYEQRMKEQEEEKFRQFLRNTNKWQSGDSAKDSL